MNDTRQNRLHLLGRQQSECGYCHSNEKTAISYGVWSEQLSCQGYQDLIDKGWRRSGKYLYKPIMSKTCCPAYTIRLDAHKFHLSKSQRKCLRKLSQFFGRQDEDHNQAIGSHVVSTPLEQYIGSLLSKNTTDCSKRLTIELQSSKFSMESYSIYRKYQMAVHHDLEEELTPARYKRFLVDSPLILHETKVSDHCRISYGSYHQEYRIDGKLFAVGVIDILPQCVSSVYFYYDPEYSHLSIGTFSALQEIYFLRTLNATTLRYYYLGYYIHSCPKMYYKAKFKPSQLLDPIKNTWVDLERCLPLLEKNKVACFEEEAAPAMSMIGNSIFPDSGTVAVAIDRFVGFLNEFEQAGLTLDRFKSELGEFVNLAGVKFVEKTVFMVDTID